MTGPARIVLVKSGRGVFVAEKAKLEAGVLTARGRLERRSTANYQVRPDPQLGPTVTRSWPMGEVREVRWGA